MISPEFDSGFRMFPEHICRSSLAAGSRRWRSGQSGRCTLWRIDLVFSDKAFEYEDFKIYNIQTILKHLFNLNTF